MPTTYYYTVDDEIIAEHTLGSTRLDYLTDALGSVVGSIGQTLSVQGTARFKPYGADLAINSYIPAFGWVGSIGYRRTGRTHADSYVRARHYGTYEGSWTTTDPLWPRELAYVYVGASPVTLSDRSGTGCPSAACAANEAWRAHGAWLDVYDIQHCYGYACTGGKWDSNEFTYCIDYVALRNHSFLPSSRVEGVRAALRFKYGNSCGYYRKAHTTGYSPAIDCIDRACTRHDQCLATYHETLKLDECNKQLYLDAGDCRFDCYKDLTRSTWQQDQCADAAWYLWLSLSAFG